MDPTPEDIDEILNIPDEIREALAGYAETITTSKNPEEVEFAKKCFEVALAEYKRVGY